MHEQIKKRQAQTARERQARLDSLLDTARNNEALTDALHSVAVHFLSAQDVDVAGISDWVCERFGVDAAVIFLAGDDAREKVPKIPRAADYDSLAQRVKHLASVCDDRVSSKLAAALFPEMEINSCAFIPIAHREQLHGVMVLGASEQERFRPDMGVLILDRLGQLIGASLSGRGLL